MTLDERVAKGVESYISYLAKPVSYGLLVGVLAVGGCGREQDQSAQTNSPAGVVENEQPSGERGSHVQVTPANPRYDINNRDPADVVGLYFERGKHGDLSGLLKLTLTGGETERNFRESYRGSGSRGRRHLSRAFDHPYTMDKPEFFDDNNEAKVLVLSIHAGMGPDRSTVERTKAYFLRKSYGAWVIEKTDHIDSKIVED